MTMDQVAKLTMRQVSLIYYRERDRKTGVPKKINPSWDNSVDAVYQQFISIGLFFGKSIEELQMEWEKANENSS